MRVLLTGFEPFGDLKLNPSQLIVEYFQTQQRPDVIALVLPTAYRASGERLEAAIRQHNPDAIISLGVAQSRPMISLERVALNVDDASRPDNDGVLASGEQIAPDGPVAYWSTLPLDAMRAALEARGIPVSISNHAGTYVCNHIFYSARHIVTAHRLSIPCGFIHVPDLATGEGDATTGLPLGVMIEAVQICLDTVRQAVAMHGSPADL